MKETVNSGCVVTFDMGPNYDAKVAPIGTFSEEQIKQLKNIIANVRQ